MNWPGWLASRFVLVPAAIGALTLAWNIYVSLHNDGIVTGSVVSPDGRPVAGVTLILYERDLTSSFVERQRTKSSDSGTFRFTGHRSHQLRLEAIAPDGRRLPAQTLRLWFQSQNIELMQPLVLALPR